VALGEVEEYDMRGFFGFLLIVLVSSAAQAGDIGKTHKYKLADLPNPITASTNDVIVVIEEALPAEAKEFKANSDNADIKVRAVAMDGGLRIVITGDKKGAATVSWYFKVKGVASGYKGLKVQIE
jgi:hypothetical protein